MRTEICVILFLIMLSGFLALEKVYANPSYIISNNETHVSILVAALIPNRLLIELSLKNNSSQKVFAEFKLESLDISLWNSTLIVKYDARIPWEVLVNPISTNETCESVQKDWLDYLQTITILIAGLTLLVSEAKASPVGEEEVLKTIEDGGVPPKGSWVSEGKLLILASKNPETYRRALDLVLKEELRVKKGGIGRLRNMFSRIRKIVNHRR